MRLALLLTIILCISCFETPEQETDRALISRGKQLVKEGNCGYCHTPLTETEDSIEPDITRWLSGHPASFNIPDIPDVKVDSERWLDFLGKLDTTVWAGRWGITFAANITPDNETGIGKWSEQMFIETMRRGRHKDMGRNLQPPMPWQDYGKLSDYDLKAIYAYLGSVKPIKNKVPQPIVFQR
jgi:mono/diheme cytochrome c family protein